MRLLAIITVTMLCMLTLASIHPVTSFHSGNAILTDTITANTYYEKAMTFRRERVNDSAMIYFEKASLLYGASDNQAKYYDAKIYYGELLARQQLYDSAMLYFENLGAEYDSSSYFNYYSRYRINQNLGIINGRRKDILASIDAFRKNVELTKKFDPKDSTKTLVNLARTFNNLAVEYMDINSLELAAQYYDSALMDLRENLDHPSELEHVIYLNQANVYKRLGFFDDALAAFDKSQSFFNLLTDGEIDDVEKGLFYWFKSSNYIYNNNLIREVDNALMYNDSAVFYISSFSPEHVYLSYCDNINAEIYIFLKKYDQAIYHINSSKDRFTKVYGEKYSGIGYLHDLMARVKLELGKFEEAEDAAMASLAHYESIKFESYEEYAESYHTLAEIYIAQKKYDNALETVQEGMKKVLPDFLPDNLLENPSVSTLLNRPGIFMLLEMKGDILSEMFQQSGSTAQILASVSCYDLATNHIKLQRNEIVSLRSKSSFTARRIGIYEKAIEVALKAHKKTKNDSLIHLAFTIADRRKSANLNERLAQERNRIGKNIPLTWQVQEKELKSKISLVEKTIFELSHQPDADPNEIDSIKLVLFELNEKHRIHLEEIKTRFPYLFNTYQDFQFDAYQYLASKKESEALINYFVGNDRIYYFLLDDGINVFETPLTPDLINDITALIESVKNRKFNYDLSFDLSEKIFNPANDLIRQSTNKELIIIPDGILNYLPFEVLTKGPSYSEEDAGNAKFLIHDYIISYYYAANLLQFLDENESKNYDKNYIGFAPSFSKTSNALIATRSAEDIRIASQLTNLPTTREEIEYSANIWDGSTYLEKDATESNFKNLSRHAQIIHLASHTIINDENPMYSKLVFSPQSDSLDDGLLHTYELYNMNLNAQLACLSACNTGFGKIEQGEGVMSLARGFMYAGVPNIMMTLWSVPDRSSSEIMKLFYQELKNGKGKAEALRSAKLTYLENADANTRDPYFWAAFTLVGNNKPMNSEPGYLIYFLSGGILALVVFSLFKFNVLTSKRT